MPHSVVNAHAHGMLEVGVGQRIHWEIRGNPAGEPAVVLHGGPGSGAASGLQRFFDPAAYRVVLFDQRGCGRSTPSAADPATDLSVNTTAHLIADIEALREHLGIERWLVFGVSWGSTLGLAYAQQHPGRVTAMVLGSVVMTTHREVDWLTRQMGRVFPVEWDRFVRGVPEADRHGNLAQAYARLLSGPDPAVRDRAAAEWCAWEDTHVATYAGHRPDPRYDDAVFRMTFARLVTHYWRHAGFLPDGQLLVDAHRLAGVPGVMVHGRSDVSSPPDVPWLLARAWPDAELVLVDEAGHGAGATATGAALAAAVDRFRGIGQATPCR